jgi:hypothetical protein
VVSVINTATNGTKSEPFGSNPKGSLIFESKSIAYFGTYSVNEADKSYTVQVEGATFPNWAGTAQRRGLSISGDELTFINSAGSAGGSNEAKYKRVK